MGTVVGLFRFEKSTFLSFQRLTRPDASTNAGHGDPDCYVVSVLCDLERVGYR